MPSTLAIETSTARGSVAVVRDGVVVFQQSFTSERSHNSQLFAPLGEALAVCSDDLQRIVVGLGPGSYTGVRIGIAAAQGIAWSRNVAVIGLPSIIAQDAADVPREFVVCGDARRGLFYSVLVSQNQIQDEITLHDAATIIARREADTLHEWLSVDDKAPLNLPRVRLVKPSAARLACIAHALRDEDVFILESRALEPVYLSAPFITQPKPRGIEHLHSRPAGA